MLDLTSIFCETFDSPSLRINLQTTPRDVAGWDSYNHLRLALAIEQTVGISFSSEEIAGMTDVAAIVSTLAAHGIKTALAVD